MKLSKINQSIGLLDETLLEEALAPSPKRTGRVWRVLSLAACLSMVWGAQWLAQAMKPPTVSYVQTTSPTAGGTVLSFIESKTVEVQLTGWETDRIFTATVVDARSNPVFKKGESLLIEISELTQGVVMEQTTAWEAGERLTVTFKRFSTKSSAHTLGNRVWAQNIQK